MTAWRILYMYENNKQAINKRSGKETCVCKHQSFAGCRWARKQSYIFNVFVNSHHIRYRLLILRYTADAFLPTSKHSVIACVHWRLGQWHSWQQISNLHFYWLLLSWSRWSIKTKIHTSYSEVVLSETTCKIGYETAAIASEFTYLLKCLANTVKSYYFDPCITTLQRCKFIT